MKFTRSMVLVSNDPESLRLGADKIFANFEKELAAFELSDEIALSKIADTGRGDILPMVVIYP
jgi:hypothetical protein